MTHRIYYREPAVLEFEAEIVTTGREGDNFYTVLNRSAFYPTSGGQIHDLGKLGEIDVIDVVESDDGEVRHITEKPVGEIGQQVKGVVDKERRWINRQVHTAQHILSQAFFRLHGLNTVSVHLGEEYANIELPTNSLTPEQLTEAEQLANETIRDNIPVEIIFADDDLIKYLPLRRPAKRSGEIRVIKIGDYDCSACGGTHCHSTAEVKLIKIIGTEKIRGRIAVRFLAGELALKDYMERFEVTDTLSREFTCHFSDLPESVRKLAEETRQLKHQINAMQKEMLPARVEQLSRQAQQYNGTAYYAGTVEDIELSHLPNLTSMLAEAIGGLAVLVKDDRLFLGVSSNSNLHAGKLMKSAAGELGLKGGGGDKLAQAGGVDPNLLKQYTEVFLKLLNG